MEVIPAIDLIGGKCVRLVKGDFKKKTVYDIDPVEKALSFERQGAKTIHIVDLDGAKTGIPSNLSVISDIRREVQSIRLEYGGGIRSIETAINAIRAGADSIIIGTAAYRDPSFLEKVMKDYGNNVVVGIDVRGESMVVDGWMSEANLGPNEYIVKILGKIGYLDNNGVRRIIYTDTEKDGTLAGVGIGNISFKRVMNRCGERGITVAYAGGVSRLEDISELYNFENDDKKERIKQFGARGENEILSAIIVGKALYEESSDFDLSMAIKIASGNMA